MHREDQVPIKLVVLCWRGGAFARDKYDRYELSAGRDWSVLNVLQYLRDNVDSSLTFYGICARGVCDGCWIQLNGEELRACTTPVRSSMKIEPLRGQPVVRDLWVGTGIHRV